MSGVMEMVQQVMGCLSFCNIDGDVAKARARVLMLPYLSEKTIEDVLQVFDEYIEMLWGEGGLNRPLYGESLLTQLKGE